MKVLIVVDYYQPKLGYSDSHIAQDLARKGHKVAVLTSNYYFPFPNYRQTAGKILGERKQASGIYSESGIKVFRKKLLFEIFARSFFSGHEEIIRKFKPDIVLANKVAGLNTWIISGLKNKYGFKLVCYDSHLSSELLREKVIIKNFFYFLFRVTLLRRINMNVDKFVAVQEGTVDIIKKYYGISKPIDFIPLGTDTKMFRFSQIQRNNIRKHYRIGEANFVIIYTGKVIQAKGIDLLFRAFDLLGKTHDNLKLLIVGDGPQEYKDACLSKLDRKHHKKVIWAGFQDNSDLYKYYSASDIAAWPLQESTAMNDAASCSLPFIANDRLGAKYRISNKNALIYKKDDYRDLAKKIEFLYLNTKERKEMGRRGRELMESEMDWSIISKRYIEIQKMSQSKMPFKLLLQSLVVVINDLLKRRYKVKDNIYHIRKALAWLERAQDVTGDWGVSKWFSLLYGWQASYVETTGYIIDTFFDCANFFNDKRLKDRAIKMADLLVSMQLPSGGFRNITPQESGDSEPIVFDSGQVILGLIRTYRETRKRLYLDSAVKAAEFLVSVQENDGSWIKYNFGGIAHSYDSRVAWALLKVFEETGSNTYKKAAIRFLDWAAGKQSKNYWFGAAHFPPPNQGEPFTHAISYVIEGFLYSGLILKNDRYIGVAKKTADRLISLYEEKDFLPGSFDKAWRSIDKYSCLVGDAQLSVVWLRLYEMTKDVKYLQASRKMNSFLKSLQITEGVNPDIMGAIKGSHPIYGDVIRKRGYCRLSFPNWAVKFFIDALLLEKMLTKND